MYGALTYRGDLSHLEDGIEVPRTDGGVTRRVPVLLGADALGHPYEVLDVEGIAQPAHYDEARDRPCPGSTTYSTGDLDAPCDTCGGSTGVHAPGRGPFVRTRVHVQPATVDTTRGNRSAAIHAQADRLAEQAAHARVRHFWRPDVWAPAPDTTAVDAVRRALLGDAA